MKFGTVEIAFDHPNSLWWLSSVATWNPKHQFINGCFNLMIPNLYIGNGCFNKHPKKYIVVWGSRYIGIVINH